MSRRIRIPALLPVLLFGLLGAAPDVRAAESADSPPLEHLVPELADSPYTMSPGPRQFLKRLSFSPGVGWLGTQRLYVFRLAYNPDRWLGYEASLGHNPGESVQALFHMVNAVVRVPLAGRFQPYGTLGYGMMHVFPGKAINADPGTENTLGYGAGLELYLRDDVALRTEVRGITVLGGQRDREGTVAYSYREATLGFIFYRAIGGN